MRLAISAVQSPNQPGDEHPKIIRPKKDGQKPLPKSQMQEPNGKQPPRKPGKSRQPAIFNFNLFHKDIIPQIKNHFTPNSHKCSKYFFLIHPRRRAPQLCACLLRTQSKQKIRFGGFFVFIKVPFLSLPTSHRCTAQFLLANNAKHLSTRQFTKRGHTPLVCRPLFSSRPPWRKKMEFQTMLKSRPLCSRQFLRK